jgi:hypothetical protein
MRKRLQDSLVTCGRLRPKIGLLQITMKSKHDFLRLMGNLVALIADFFKVYHIGGAKELVVLLC